jgi:hypothetical protein
MKRIPTKATFRKDPATTADSNELEDKQIQMQGRVWNCLDC